MNENSKSFFCFIISRDANSTQNAQSKPSVNAKQRKDIQPKKKHTVEIHSETLNAVLKHCFLVVYQSTPKNFQRQLKSRHKEEECESETSHALLWKHETNKPTSGWDQSWQARKCDRHRKVIWKLNLKINLSNQCQRYTTLLVVCDLFSFSLCVCCCCISLFLFCFGLFFSFFFCRFYSQTCLQQTGIWPDRKIFHRCSKTCHFTIKTNFWNKKNIDV